MKLPISRGTLRLIGVLVVLSALFLVGMFWYYDQQNRAVDPRMVEVRRELDAYQDLLAEQQWSEALAVLDQAERTVKALPAYRNSYERGVIENDRMAVYLLMLEHRLLAMGESPTLDDEGRWLLERARKHGQKALEHYESWRASMAGLSVEEIEARLAAHFQPTDPALEGRDADMLLNKRVEEIQQAHDELDRRMSVTVTNLGVAARYAGNAPLAKQRYERALELWADNHAAEDNLDRLLGRKPKRRIIEKLFPPER